MKPATMQVIVFVALGMLACGQTVLLPDGSELTGTIVHDSGHGVVLEYKTFRLKVGRDNIASVTGTSRFTRKLDLSKVDTKLKTAVNKAQNPQDIVTALSSFGQCLVPLVAHGVRREDPRFTPEAVCALLRQWQSPEGIPLVLGYIESPDPQVRTLAMRTLRYIPCQATAHILLRISRIREFGEDPLDILCELAHEHPTLEIPELLLKSLQNLKSLGADEYPLVGAMGRLNCGSQALMFLEKLTQDKNETLAMSAFQALAQSPDATHTLLKLLNRGDEFSKKQAMYALGTNGSFDAIPKLIPYLEVEERPLRFSAHWSLQKISGRKLPPVADVWHRWWREREGQLAQLENLHELLYRANDHGQIRTTLAGMAAIQDRASIPVIAELLGNPDPEVRSEACHALWKFKDRQAVLPLIDALKDEPQVRQAALVALHRLTGWQELPAHYETWQVWWTAQPENNAGSNCGLLKLLAGEMPAVSAGPLLRIMAATALGDCKEQQAIPLFLDILADAVEEGKMPESQQEFSLLAVAAHNLGRMKSKTAIPILIEALDYENAELRRVCHNALVHSTGQNFPCRCGPWMEWWNLHAR